jgi:predicted nucleic acid-binding protein
MTGVLVDTDWAILVLHGDSDATKTLIDRAGDGLATSVITYGELFEGAYYARDPLAAAASLTAFLDGKDLLVLTTVIVERFAILRGQLPRHHRQQIGDMDLLIAATAIAHGLELFTNNRRDFVIIPGLTIYTPESPT